MNICIKRKTYKELQAENAALKKENKKLKKDNKYLISIVSKNKECKKSVPRFKPPIIVGESQNQYMTSLVEDIKCEEITPRFRDPIIRSWP